MDTGNFEPNGAGPLNCTKTILNNTRSSYLKHGFINQHLLANITYLTILLSYQNLMIRREESSTLKTTIQYFFEKGVPFSAIALPGYCFSTLFCLNIS